METSTKGTIMKVKPTKKKNRVMVELGRTDTGLLAEAADSRSFALKKILVPIDFSQCSLKALRYAVAFARQFKASITLLYVVQQYYLPGDFTGGLDYASLEKEIEENSARELETIATREIGRKAPWKVLLRMGRPVDQITRIADELNVDLIILATHGHTGLKHVVLGSTAENVVRHAPCPVLTVRVNEHDFLRA
jgi:nucleotide-binding universal stress UspA family protein